MDGTFSGATDNAVSVVTDILKALTVLSRLMLTVGTVITNREVFCGYFG